MFQNAHGVPGRHVALPARMRVAADRAGGGVRRAGGRGRRRARVADRRSEARTRRDASLASCSSDATRPTPSGSVRRSLGSTRLTSSARRSSARYRPTATRSVRQGSLSRTRASRVASTRSASSPRSRRRQPARSTPAVPRPHGRPLRRCMLRGARGSVAPLAAADRRRRSVPRLDRRALPGAVTEHRWDADG